MGNIFSVFSVLNESVQSAIRVVSDVTNWAGQVTVQALHMGARVSATLVFSAAVIGGSVLPGVRDMLITVRETTNQRQIQWLDHVLVKAVHGNCKTLDKTSVARTGWHVRFWDDISHQWVPVLLNRKVDEKTQVVSYDVFGMTNDQLDEFFKNVVKVYQQDHVNDIPAYKIISTDILSHNLAPIEPRMHSPLPWQTQLAQQIVQIYQGNRQVCHSFMISGGPGTGKSTIANYVGLHLRQHEPALDFMIVHHFNPTTPALNLWQHVLSQRTNPSTLIILVLDEFDISIKYAMEQKADQMMQVCHAKDKVNLTGFLDSLNNEISNIIVIGTSNQSLEELRAYDQGVYMRPGRFTHHMTLQNPIAQANQANQNQEQQPPPPQLQQAIDAP